MQYKDFCGERISTLGMGNMRLPTTEERGPIDREKARAIIEHAHESGVNYFDTAYRYHSGESETFVGEVLSQYPRDSFYLATKMPGHMMYYKDGKLGFQGYLANEEVTGIPQIFEDQLQRCRVEYFDFYLLHNVCESSYDFYTNEELGVVRYLVEQKKAGRIKHLGFSSHGHAETIDKFLNQYPGIFEFVQLQLNYLDWELQKAGDKYDAAVKHGLDIIIMEPVRGGRLAKLPETAETMLKEAKPEATVASWAFRFLQSLPKVGVVLSGMTTMEQLNENLELFSNPQPTTEAEIALLQKVVQVLADMVPCTACRYCCEDCPQGLDIPRLIGMYNEFKSDGLGILNFNLRGMAETQLPGACIGCGACARVCPQSIDIPGVMANFAEALKG